MFIDYEQAYVHQKFPSAHDAGLRRVSRQKYFRYAVVLIRVRASPGRKLVSGRLTTRCFCQWDPVLLHTLHYSNVDCYELMTPARPEQEDVKPPEWIDDQILCRTISKETCLYLMT